MEENVRWTTCRWCGAELGPDEDWLEGKNSTPAVWCPDCDGLTYLNPADDKRKMTLILEHRKTQMEFAPQTQGKKRTQLRKRLSPLRYPGGKSKVIDELYESLDEARLDTFVELFAGGASFGLSLLEAGKTQRLILNDADPCVANFWRAATKFTDDLIDEINAEGTPTQSRFYQYRSELSELREAYLQGPERDILSGKDAEWCVQKAARFLVVNRLSFGGLQTSNLLGGANGNYLQRWNPKGLIKRLESIKALSDRIFVRCQDATRLLMEEMGWMGDNTTIFVDPPYFEAGSKLYPYGFKDGHAALAESLNQFYRDFPGPYLVITYDDVPEIRDLYLYADVKGLGSQWSLLRTK